MRLLGTVLAVIFVGLVALDASEAAAFSGDRGDVVVANRDDGTISIINVATDAVTTVNLPGTDPEPMYVVSTNAPRQVLVGDRANDQVVSFNPKDWSVNGTAPTGNGVFHMWAGSFGRQLWVNNDVDNTATVIDPRTLQVVATVDMPADRVALGGKPHDVIVEPFFRSGAFVSMVGFANSPDYIIKFSTRTFQEVARAQVGKDPHVSLSAASRLLYVPAQNSNVVEVLSRRTLQSITTIPVPGAHGAGMGRRVFYTTNLPGGGTDGLFAINTRLNTVIGSVDTPRPVPHNIALADGGRKIYVTHSGATATEVSIYKASKSNPVPVFDKIVTAGLNPFGIAFSR